MPEMTIYVTGGVDWFYTVLNAVAMIFNNGSLLSGVTLMGALFAIITGAWFYIQRNVGSGLLKTHTWLEHAFIMTVVFSVSCVPTRVTVQGIYGTQSVAVVDNVPLIAALPSSIFSTISHEIFLTVDTAFQSTSGSYMSTSEEGFAAPLKLLFAMRGGLEFVSSDLAASIRAYAARCSRGSQITMEGLSRSQDLLTYLTTNARSGGVSETYLNLNGTPTASGPYQTQSAQAEMVSCSDAAARIVAGWAEFEAPSTGGTTSDMETLLNYNIKETSNSGSPEVRANSTAYQNAFNLLIGTTGQSAQKFMQNSLMADLLADTYRCMSRGATQADMLTCTQLQHNAMEAYKIDATASANMFTKTMLPAMTLLQLLFFAFGVIIFFYGMLRGALVLSALAKYMVFGMWVFSWLPFVAVINAFIQWMVVDKVNSIANEGLTMANKGVYMYDTLSTNLAMASDLLAITPLMTLGLLTGSAYAMTGIAQRLSAPRDYVDEKQAAPATSSVGPVVQTSAQLQSNTRTGLTTSDFAPYKYSYKEDNGESERSAYTQMTESRINQIRSGINSAGQIFEKVRSSSLTNDDTLSDSLSAGTVANVGYSTLKDYVEKGTISQAEAVSLRGKINADLGIKGEVGGSAAISTPGGGGSGGAGGGKVSLGASGSAGVGLDLSADQSIKTEGGLSTGAQEALNASRSNMGNYVSQKMGQVADKYSNVSGTTGREIQSSINSYTRSNQKAESDAQSWERAQQASRSVGTSIDLDTLSFGRAILSDNQLGRNGYSWSERIGVEVDNVRRTEDPNTFDALVNSYTRRLTADGASRPYAVQEQAQLLALSHYDQSKGFYNQVLSEATVSRPISADTDSNQGVGSAAAAMGRAGGYTDNVGAPTMSMPRGATERSSSQRAEAAQELDKQGGNAMTGIAENRSVVGDQFNEKGGAAVLGTEKSALETQAENHLQRVGEANQRDHRSSDGGTNILGKASNAAAGYALEDRLPAGVEAKPIIEQGAESQRAHDSSGFQPDGSYRVTIEKSNTDPSLRDPYAVGAPTRQEVERVPGLKDALDDKNGDAEERKKE